MSRHDARVRAFSLIEVLMAIIILGIGVISIAALFPAGIAQQRRSIDDVMGPIVANNAVAILRSKLRPSDFGSFEQFSPPVGLGGAQILEAPRFTMTGDWTWLRPSILLLDDPDTDEIDEAGALDVFAQAWPTAASGEATAEFAGGYVDVNNVASDPPLHGIPFNRVEFGDEPPRMIVTREERYYPMAAQGAQTGEDPVPQYVWDCMFRRYQGRILVAVFVYRVNQGSGEARPYMVAGNPSNPIPPVPVWLEIANAANPHPGWDAYGADGVLGTPDDVRVAGTDPCRDYDLFDAAQSWQEPGQWLLDQNGNVHRVLTSYCDDALPNPQNAPRVVELTRAVPGIFPALAFGGGPSYALPPTIAGNAGVENVVSDIWYVPAIDGNGAKLTPVYLAVMEL
jgi:prepilin-type N-terminal cleavage/methylation domain-containing protein